MAADQTVVFGLSERIGQHFVRDIVEVLVTEATMAKLRQHGERPAPRPWTVRRPSDRANGVIR
jgi:hypothetical protein